MTWGKRYSQVPQLYPAFFVTSNMSSFNYHRPRAFFWKALGIFRTQRVGLQQAISPAFRGCAMKSLRNSEEAFEEVVAMRGSRIGSVKDDMVIRIPTKAAVALINRLRALDTLRAKSLSRSGKKVMR